MNDMSQENWIVRNTTFKVWPHNRSTLIVVSTVISLFRIIPNVMWLLKLSLNLRCNLLNFDLLVILKIISYLE